MQQFSSQPHAAPAKRKAYRDEEEPEIFNLMNDPRIVRGSTFAPKVITLKAKQEMTVRTKTVSTKKQFSNTKRVGTPPPVEGRVHMDLQTDDFLEELTDKPVCSDNATQTQAILDRPQSPLFIRTKTGVDISTQIEDGDLFDFDYEVQPILEILCGKTLHVAMLEVMQEEELEAIALQQREFESVRNVELVEVQRLEAEEKRKLQEKEKRVDQERKRLQDKKALESKIAARCFAQQYLSSLHTDVFDTLESQGVFYDPTKKEIEDQFMYGLMAGITLGAEKFSAAKSLTDELLATAMRRSKDITINALKQKALAEAAAAELAAKQPIPVISATPQPAGESTDE
jgi:hypothetical protein